jgi:hypothetical protein
MRRVAVWKGKHRQKWGVVEDREHRRRLEEASSGRRSDGEERKKKRHELRRAGTLTWALIPCHEYATCIPEGPKATIYSTCTGVKYAGHTLTIRETTKYKYSSNNSDMKTSSWLLSTYKSDFSTNYLTMIEGTQNRNTDVMWYVLVSPILARV